MPRSSRPASKPRKPSSFPPPRDAVHFGSVDGKRYAGTVLGAEHAFGDENAPLDAEAGLDEWE